MKKSFIVASMLLLCYGAAVAQPKNNYTNTQVVNVPQHFQGMLITPMLCDYQVLTPNSVSTELLSGVLVSSIPQNSLNDWISELVLEGQEKLIKEHQADAIVGLSRSISTTADGKLKVAVSGFPVKYVNFRVARQEDLWILQFYNYLNADLEHKDLGNKTVKEISTGK